MTYKILAGAVSETSIQGVLRAVHLHVRTFGVSGDEIREWGQHPFPFLRNNDYITAIGDYLEWLVRPGGVRATPQIVWHLPNHVPDDCTLTPHVDVPPDGQHFTAVVGVALTPWTPENGTIRVWSNEHEYDAVWLHRGDVLIMQPDTLHSPGINYAGDIRCGLYFRWLADGSRDT